MMQFIAGAVCFAAGMFSGVAAMCMAVSRKPNDTEVIIFAGGSREQDNEPGGQHDKIKWPTYHAGRPEGFGRY